jgi:cytochrome c553
MERGSMDEQQDTRPEEPETEAAQSAAGSGAAEPEAAEAQATTGPRCPWCSAPIPPDATTCPSCHAALASSIREDTPGIPGVTEVDATLLAYKPATRKPQRIVDTLIRFLDEDQEEILAGLYPEPEKRGGKSATAPPEGAATEVGTTAATAPAVADAAPENAAPAGADPTGADPAAETAPPAGDA